jgi:hypothetical protein
MRNAAYRCLVLLAVLLSAWLGQCQQITVQNEAGKSVVFSKSDIEALPHVKVSARMGESSANFEGVSVKAILEKAGVEFGESLRGKRLASYLLVEAADSYRVVIALPELDPAFSDKQIVLAFAEDDKPLDAKSGPYRLVIPDEKRMARWVRQVTALKVVAAP